MIDEVKMDIIKRLFSFNDDDSCAIGLCKFSDDFYKQQENKEQFKRKISKDVPISQMLKRNI
ncbi:MAG: hypothetical protein E7Z88_07245 [Cyanobacteria bacterium SIG27]|nr:hypothetical protein [Cyanobacteria bacterium SIG27]